MLVRASLVLMLSVLAGCVTGPSRPPAPLPGYALVWNDEFEGTDLDPAKWSHYALGPRRDAVNVKEAAEVRDGLLRITTTRHDIPQAQGPARTEFRTGMISTRGLYETTYGYFECRMRVQREIGHWSAFWINTPTMGKPEGDPERAGVEIDVIEYLKSADYADKANHTIHWDYKTPSYKRDFTRVTMPEIAEGFHVYACEWTPEHLAFFVDGRETWRTGKAIPRRDQHMILSVEIGKWAGDIRQAKLPDGIEVDWVRVWKLK